LLHLPFSGCGNQANGEQRAPRTMNLQAIDEFSKRSNKAA
jgi:hypothetical protein